jgi:hypothetical protein
LMVCTESGVVCVRSVRRLPLEGRRSMDFVKWVKWAPWYMYRGCEDADGDLPQGVPLEERTMGAGSSSGDRIVCMDTSEKAPRDSHIRKTDAERFGYTRGFGGCSSWHRGLGRQPHTEECRKRFKELMKDDAKVMNNEIRRKEFENKEIEKKRKSGNVAEGSPRVEDQGEMVSGPRGDIEMKVKPDNKAQPDGSIAMDVVEIMNLVGEWVSEVQGVMKDE